MTHFLVCAASLSYPVQVLLIDADNTVCCDPEFLFETPQYMSTGALFWCDMYALDEKFVRMYDPWQVEWDLRVLVLRRFS